MGTSEFTDSGICCSNMQKKKSCWILFRTAQLHKKANTFKIGSGNRTSDNVLLLTPAIVMQPIVSWWCFFCRSNTHITSQLLFPRQSTE